MNQGSEKGQLNKIELARLKAQKESLTDKLSDYIPERLISGGHNSIEQMLDDIQNYEYAINYPPGPSFKWQNSEIERLEKITDYRTLNTEEQYEWETLHSSRDINVEILSNMAGKIYTDIDFTLEQ